MKQHYTGPIFFIIHSPEENPETKKSNVHTAKIIQVLNLAGQRQIPVLYVHPKSEKLFLDLMANVKNKPKIIHADYDSLNDKAIRKALTSAKVTPTKITILGHYREECIGVGAEIMRVLFPKAELHMLNGKYSLMFTEGSRAMHRSISDHYRVLHAKPSSRLKSVHFAK